MENKKQMSKLLGVIAIILIISLIVFLGVGIYTAIQSVNEVGNVINATIEQHDEFNQKMKEYDNGLNIKD